MEAEVSGGGGGGVCARTQSVFRDGILTKQFHLSCIRLLAVEFNTETIWCLLHCGCEWTEEACDSVHPLLAERNPLDVHRGSTVKHTESSQLVC